MAPTEGMDAAVEAAVNSWRDDGRGGIGSGPPVGVKFRRAIEAAEGHLRAAWEEEMREKLLSEEAVEAAVEAVVVVQGRPSTVYSRRDAYISLDAALDTAFGQEEGK